MRVAVVVTVVGSALIGAMWWTFIAKGDRYRVVIDRCRLDTYTGRLVCPDGTILEAPSWPLGWRRTYSMSRQENGPVILINQRDGRLWVPSEGRWQPVPLGD